MRLLTRLFFPIRLYWAALSDVAAYPETLKLSRWLVAFCLWVIYALFSLATTVDFGWRTLPSWQNDWQRSWEKIKQNWPENLNAEYQSGKLQLDPEQVIILPYPAPLTNRPGFPTNFLRLDTRQPPENPHDSLLFITSENLIAESTVPLTEILGDQNWRLTKNDLPNFDDQIRKILAVIGQSLIISHFLFSWVGLLAARLIGLIFYSWVAQAFFYFAGTRLRFGKTYALGMVALLPAETAQLLIDRLYPAQNLPVFWWVWLIIMAIVAWVNRKSPKK